MDQPEIDVIIWLVLGAVFILLEFVVPGLIIVFLGMGALIVAALAHFGIIQFITYQVLSWAALSLILLLVLRNRFAAIFPSLETRGYKREDEEIIGMSVDVVRDVSPENENGQVRLHGVIWKARSVSEETIRAGEKARIIKRDNLLLIVENVKEP